MASSGPLPVPLLFVREGGGLGARDLRGSPEWSRGDAGSDDIMPRDVGAGRRGRAGTRANGQSCTEGPFKPPLTRGCVPSLKALPSARESQWWLQELKRQEETRLSQFKLVLQALE